MIQDVYYKTVGRREQFTDLRSSINAIRKDLLGRVSRVVVAELLRQSVTKTEITPAPAVVQVSAAPFTPLQPKVETSNKIIVTHSAGPLKKRAKKLIT